MHATASGGPMKMPRRIAKPMASLDGDNLVEIRRAVRETRAEFSKNIRSYRTATTNQMNKELAIQYKDEVLRIKAITREQNRVYRIMCQTYETRKRLSREQSGRSTWEGGVAMTSFPVQLPGTNNVLKKRLSKIRLTSLSNRPSLPLNTTQDTDSGERENNGDHMKTTRKKSTAKTSGVKKTVHSIETSPTGNGTDPNGLGEELKGHHLLQPVHLVQTVDTAAVELVTIPTSPSAKCMYSRGSQKILSHQLSVLPAIQEDGNTSSNFRNSANMNLSGMEAGGKSSKQRRIGVVNPPLPLVLDVVLPSIGSEPDQSGAYIVTGIRAETNGSAEFHDRRSSSTSTSSKSSKVPLSIERKKEKAQKEQKMKKILDSEEVPVYNKSEKGFDQEGNMYQRRTFKPPSSAAAKRRLRLTEKLQQRIAAHNEKIQSFFGVAEVEQDPQETDTIATKPLEDPASDSWETSSARPSNVSRQSLASSVAGELLSGGGWSKEVAGCMYVRQYIRPEERDPYRDHATSWDQRALA